MGWSRNAMMGTLPSLLNPSENEAIDCSAGFPKDTVGKRILQNDTTRTWPALQDAVTNRRSSRSAAGGLLLLYALPPLRSAMTGRVFRFGKSFQSVDFKVQFACKCMQMYADTCRNKTTARRPGLDTIADGGGVSRDFGNWKLAMATNECAKKRRGLGRRRRSLLSEARADVSISLVAFSSELRA